MNVHKKLVATFAVVGVTSILGATFAPDSALPFHERKEVAGLAIVFGAEPEPALTEEMQFLRWRVSTLDGEEAYTELSGEVSISFGGVAQGSFPVGGVRGTPGSYQTRHIFTEPGEYSTVLTFKKGEAGESHTVDFNFNINDRSDLQLPRRRGGGR
jgi:hypothetical protein